MSLGHTSSSRWESICEAAVTCVYLGYAPLAPGTAGSLAAVAIYAVVEAFRVRLSFSPIVSTTLIAGLAVSSSAVGIALGRWAEQRYRRKDPQQFALDEAAGFLATAFPAPVLFPAASPWLAVVVTFVSARAFDIIKLPPARQLERLPGGWGIVLDDLASALYSCIASCLVLWWLR